MATLAMKGPLGGMLQSEVVCNRFSWLASSRNTASGPCRALQLQRLTGTVSIAYKDEIKNCKRNFLSGFPKKSRNRCCGIGQGFAPKMFFLV